MFPGEKISNKIIVTELNEILSNSAPNSRSKQAYVKGFDCEYIAFEADVNMFECMEIA